jgi:hypothetical protein
VEKRPEANGGWGLVRQDSDLEMDICTVVVSLTDLWANSKDRIEPARAENG